MHTRTKRKLQPVYLFPLPEGILEVKIYAFEQGLKDAVAMCASHKLASPEQAIQVRALGRLDDVFSQPVHGKRITNDRALFKELFLRTYNHAAAAMFRLLKNREGSSHLLDTVQDSRQVAYLHQYTMEHLDFVEHAYMGYAFDLAPLSEEV